jgi:hypothetical protein
MFIRTRFETIVAFGVEWERRRQCLRLLLPGLVIYLYMGRVLS